MQDKRAQKKKKLLIVLCGFAGVFVLLLAVLGILSLVSSRLHSNATESDVLPDQSFYEPDYDRNILEDPAYLRLDHSVLYMEYGTGQTLTEENYEKAGVASRFFYTFFDSIIRGDADTYRSLLTDSFKEKHTVPERFTMQMLYNISVNLDMTAKETTYQGKQAIAYYFSVTYSLYRNDGTFRRDIAGSTPVTQYYEVYAVDGKWLLNEMLSRNVKPSA